MSLKLTSGIKLMHKAENRGQVEHYFGLTPGADPQATKAATFGGGIDNGEEPPSLDKNRSKDGD